MSTMKELSNFMSRKYGGSSAENLNSLQDMLHARGRSTDAILYSILFMPELVLIDDSVILGWGLPDEISKKRFLTATADNKTRREELEASFNFVEIGYLFDAEGRDTSDNEDELLAKLLCDAWAGYLKNSYPDRSFVIEILAADITGSTVGIQFYEAR